MITYSEEELRLIYSTVVELRRKSQTVLAKRTIAPNYTKLREFHQTRASLCSSIMKKIDDEREIVS